MVRPSCLDDRPDRVGMNGTLAGLEPNSDAEPRDTSARRVVDHRTGDPSTVAAAEERAETRLPTQGGAGSVRPTVLIVEDDPDMLELLTIWFRSARSIVLPAGSAEQGLSVSRGRRLDLAVVDLLLTEGMNGWELTDQLRAQHAGTAIAVCSILDPADYPPADAQLPKPCTRQDVHALMDRLRDRWERPAS
jgi:CheY-like chemotaxis protein